MREGSSSSCITRFQSSGRGYACSGVVIDKNWFLRANHLILSAGNNGCRHLHLLRSANSFATGGTGHSNTNSLLRHPGFIIDLVKDIEKINRIALNAKKTGAIVLGGGLVKHHILNANTWRYDLHAPPLYFPPPMFV